jgi:hypothetical protein
MAGSFIALLLSACAGNGETAAAPTTAMPTAVLRAVSATAAPTPATVNTPMTKPTGSAWAAAMQPQTVEAANVTVKVTPLTLKQGEPPVFDIAMDTHSVDLAGDMLKTVVLRDDTGKEYAPSTWDGAGPGGHHREGKIKFAPVTTTPKSLTLVVKNLAGVPERAFKWDVEQDHVQ